MGAHSEIPPSNSNPKSAKTPKIGLSTAKLPTIGTSRISSLSTMGLGQLGSISKISKITDGLASINASRIAGINTWTQGLSVRQVENDAVQRAKLVNLENRLDTALRELADEKSNHQRTASDYSEKLAIAQSIAADVKQMQELHFLVTKVTDRARDPLFANDILTRQFFSTDQCPAFVMSMDVRRSTELMLKARSPADFASFMTSLCDDLADIIKDRYGVVDKFTGDGVLAFFPEFFSGEDAGYFAISTAEAAHQAFAKR